MNKFLIAALFFASIQVLPLSAGHDSKGGQSANNLVFITRGLSNANDYSGELPDVFYDWCDGSCFPSTKMEILDAKTEKPKGMIYSWGKDFVDDGNIPPQTLCFSEFIMYQLDQGDLYTISTGDGACGAFMNPALVTPISDPNAVILAGGGDGVIAGGTRKFKNWSGTYSTRLFVEFLDGNIHYYDELFYRLTRSK